MQRIHPETFEERMIWSLSLARVPVMFVVAFLVLLRRVRPEWAAALAQCRGLSLTLSLASCLGSSVCLAQTDLSEAAGESGAEATAPASSEDAGKRFVLLREGTRIPATVGRIIPVGRRWAFLPDHPDQVAHLQHAQQDTAVSSSPQSPTVEELRRLMSQRQQTARPSRLGSVTRLVRTPDASPFRTPAHAETEDAAQATEGDNPNQIILVENLMLQRIVDAVSHDASDIRWTVTGEILEFRNQNRLLIHTAQRAAD